MPTPQQSPPKRMTRARAKAVEDKKSTAKTINIAAPSAKAVTARTAKRKTRADDEDKIPELPSSPEADSLSSPDSKTIHPKRVTVIVEPDTETRAEAAKTLVIKRPRGRPRKLGTDELAKLGQTHSNLTSVSSREQLVGEKKSMQSTKAKLNAPPLRKKVTFDIQDSEKEHVVRHPATPAKASKQQEMPMHVPVLGQIGLNARPIRQAQTTRGRGKRVVNRVVPQNGRVSQPSVEEKQFLNEIRNDGFDDVSDDFIDGRSSSKSNTVHHETGKPAVEQTSPAKLASQIAAGFQITPTNPIPEGNNLDERIMSTGEPSSTAQLVNHINVKTPGQRAAISAANSMSKLDESALHGESKLTTGKAMISMANSIVQPPKKIQLEQGPSVPVFKVPALPNKITGSPIRRPGASVNSMYPGTSVKPAAAPIARSSIYGTPARKPVVQSNRFVPTLSANSFNFDKTSSLMHSSPRRPSSPQRPVGSSCVLNDKNDDVKFTSSLYGSPARRPTSPIKAFTLGVVTKLAPSGAKAGPLTSPPRRPSSPQKDFTVSSTTKPHFMSTISKAAVGKSPAHQIYTTSDGSPVSNRRNRPLTTPMMSAMTKFSWSQTPEGNSVSSSEMVTSAFKSSRSPEAMYRVHRMTPEEQANVLQEELRSAPSPFTPYVKSARKDTKSRARGASRHDSHAFDKSLAKEHSSRAKNLKINDQAMHGTMDVPAMTSHVTEENDSSTTPPGTPLAPSQSIHNIQLRAQGILSNEDDSEDELQADATIHVPSSAALTDRSQLGAFVPSTATPKQVARTPRAASGKEVVTALADRFSRWEGISPRKEAITNSAVEDVKSSPVKAVSSAPELFKLKVISSPVKFSLPSFQDKDITNGLLLSPEKPSQFEEAMAIREDPEGVSFDTSGNVTEDDMFRQSQISESSQEYGDENAVPVGLIVPQASIDKEPVTCTPARVFSKQPFVVHTVSKVPLKPSAEYDESPLARPRRSNSLSGPLSKQSEFDLQALRQVRPLRPAPRTPLAEKSTPLELSPLKPTQQLPSTPETKHPPGSSLGTPARTPHLDINSSLLSGCIAFVDVHTTEGSDASGIFVELLTQMGARCVKQWAWNPKAIGSSAENSTGDVEETKVGITHVVFKDGGRRTMEKVREAKGLVISVGVGWVLDCERENKWLDECDYTIDTSTIPRGGHRRRKSMEPKALSSHYSMPTTPTLSPTKEFLNLDSPTSANIDISSTPNPTLTIKTTILSNTNPQEESQDITPSKSNITSSMPVPLPAVMTTPQTTTTITIHKDNDDTIDTSTLSPTTPYFLHPQKLIQQTCPPKQSQELLFGSREGAADYDGGAMVRRKLDLARRKSLQWAPRVGSPLKGVL